MIHRLQLPFRLLRPAPDPALAEGMLRALESPQIDPGRLAPQVAEDPALTLALLWMSPLEGPLGELSSALTHRLESAGTALLRAWLLYAGSRQPPTPQSLELTLGAARTARLARRLAQVSDYPWPDEAYLAGLWLATGELSLAASAADDLPRHPSDAPRELRLDDETQRYGIDHLQLAEALARACALPASIIDTMALMRASDEQLRTAHPLAAIVRAATLLAEAHDRVGAAARVLDLPVETVAAVRADADGSAPERPVGSDSVVPDHRERPTYPVLPTRWRIAAVTGLLSDCFADVADGALFARLDQVFRLLFDTPAPLMLIDRDERLTAMCPADVRIDTRQVETLRLRSDDDTSVVALALRTQSLTSQFPGQATPSRSPKDWHLARWLDARGIVCLPWALQEHRGVAVVGLQGGPALGTEEQQLMAVLVRQAATRQVSDQRWHQQLEAHATARETALLAHVRRIRHEIRNPLTVMRSYLGLMAGGGNTDGGQHLPALEQELERVDRLLSQLTEPTAEADGDRDEGASINRVVQSLRDLHGEVLFTARGRQLEVRLPPALPRVAMPVAELTQVLLNLVRNAAEALPEGGKLSITSPGLVIANGRTAIELRLIDDGPGIPESRAQHLFDPTPSDKGDGHEGLGLSIVKRILDRFGAYIFCRTLASQGTGFQIHIPVVDSAR